MTAERALRFWPVTLLLLLLPLWATGMFGRWYWTPDEPREADIAWNMVGQTQKSVPLMAGTPFCEKPPLTYWTAGASMALLGKSPAAARVPNLVWAMLSVLAIAWLAYAWAGPAAAIAAGIAVGTMALNAQVAWWLASDAPLVAGVCIALLGAYRGLLAATPGSKLTWYLVMHGGLLVGFLAKNIIAWVIPGLAICVFIAWDRRWRELLRIEPYVGLLLQVIVLGPWIIAVADQADGMAHLKVFFYDNLVGRFIPVESAGNYQDGHKNWPFKYLVELPAFIAPWLFLAVATVRRAWTGVREDNLDRSAWRWAVCVFVPATLLLTVSSTARGIYLAPVLPGLALGLGLWAARHLAEPDRLERWCLWATAGLFATVGLLIGPACLALIGYDGRGTDAGTILTIVVGGLAAGALAVKLLWFQHHGHGPAMLFTAMLLVDVALLVAWRGAFPVLDRWQNLTPVMARVAAVAENRLVITWQPDETTVSYLDYVADLRLPGVTSRAELRAKLETEPRTVVFFRRRAGDVAEVAAEGLVETEVLTVPHGREYVLMARPDATAKPASP